MSGVKIMSFSVSNLLQLVSQRVREWSFSSQFSGVQSSRAAFSAVQFSRAKREFSE
jgi:hypothetical protein